MVEMGAMGTRSGDRSRDMGDTSRAHSTLVPAAGETAAFAAEVRRLTNYEVWRNVESALLALTPGQEWGEAELWNLRILLEELKWRYSGLEGAGLAPSRVPLNIYPN